jgi:hypothetical protein
MKENILNAKNSPQHERQKLAQQYLSRYAKELQLHFTLSDKELKKVILKTGSLIKTESSVNNFLNMVRLLCKKCKKEEPFYDFEDL